MRLDDALARPLDLPLQDDGPGRGPTGVHLRPAVFGTAAVTLVVVALVALLPGGSDPAPESALAAAADVAASQSPPELAEDEFIYRRSETWRVGAPGYLFNGEAPSPQGPGTDQRSETDVYLNYTGGGETETTQLTPKGDAANECTQTEVLLAYIVDGFGGCGANRGVLANSPLFDQSLELREGPWASPEVSATGAGVDDLPSDPAELSRRLDSVAHDRAREIAELGSNELSDATEAAAQLETVAEVLANPVGSPGLRAAVFEYAKTIPGITVAEGIEDPLGRPGTAISLDEPSRWGQISISGPGVSDNFHLDREDTTVQRRLIFDPETSDVLAVTASLLETDNALLGPWLEQRGAPQLVKYQVFETPRVVERPELVLERVTCPDGTTVIRPESAEGECPETLDPEAQDEAAAILDRIEKTRSPDERKRLMGRLEVLRESAD